MATEVLCNRKTPYKCEDQLIADDPVQKGRGRVDCAGGGQVLWAALATIALEVSDGSLEKVL